MSIVVFFLALLVGVALMTLGERKVMSMVQNRVGPNRVGSIGLWQAFTDGVKLLLKENLLPTSSHHLLYLFTPVLAFGLALFNWLAIPLTPYLVLGEFLASFLGLLMVVAIAELAVYGVVLSGCR